MKDDREDLLRLATALTDGAVIDWEREERVDGELRGKVRHLRSIEKLMTAQSSPEPETRSTAEDMSVTQTLPSGPAGPAAASLPFTTWGPLHIICRLDEGGSGEVFRAHDPALQKDVALKLLRAGRSDDKRNTSRFLEEARRLARVRHPNVLTVHGVATHNDRAGLWTDLIEGKTLEQLLRAQGPLGWEEAAVIGGRLCQALAAVHAEGLVHHDVKTSNVMREEAGRIVLMDFSTADDRFSERARMEGNVALGTPRFMAPERFKGQDSGPSSDVYSLGVILYRLVTRRFPVEDRDRPELADRSKRVERVPLRDVRPDLPPAFVQVVERALDPDPSRRFATMGEMERALAAVRGVAIDGPSETTAHGTWEVIRSFLDNTWVRASLGIAAILTAGIFLVYPPPEFRVEASLYRHGDGVEERLLPGGRVSPGDSLFLEISGSDEMHVYVLNADSTGNSYVLFPLPGFDLRNPLAGGTKHRLPGTLGGQPYSWTGTSAGGRETFLVIASRGPLRDFEAQIGHIQSAKLGAPAPLDTQAILALRGFGGLQKVEPKVEGDVSRPFSGILRDISRRAAAESGLWAWEIELDNPGP